MRALSESFMPMYKEAELVFASATAGEYDVILGAGLYRAVLIGGGGGGACEGWKSGQTSGSIPGAWGAAAGGGGCAIEATFRVRKTGTAQVTVGSSGVGSFDVSGGVDLAKQWPSDPTATAQGTAGGSSTLEVGATSITAGGGSGGIVSVDSYGMPTSVAGSGGVAGEVMGCSASTYTGRSGEYSETYIQNLDPRWNYSGGAIAEEIYLRLHYLTSGFGEWVRKAQSSTTVELTGDEEIYKAQAGSVRIWAIG